MLQGNLIEQGLELMVFGMGAVVVFLSLLVLATSLMSILVQRLVPAPPEPAPEEGNSPADAQLLAAVAAAVHKHRSRPGS